MEVVRFDEQSYQLGLQAYQTTFPDFKYESASFASMEIRTNSKVPTTPSMLQPITKLISPPRGGTCLEIIPLFFQTFTILISLTIVVNQLVEGSERSNKEQVETINLSFTILYSRLKSLEFISTSVPLTPHHIGIGQEVTLISSTPHASKVFITPIVTFEDTFDR
jgi:hypothetical protein